MQLRDMVQILKPLRGGRLGETASAVSKNIALKHMSKLGRKNHEDNIIYIHDLDHYEPGDHNCLTYPVDTSLENGVETRQTDIRKSGSVNTSMQLVAVFFQLQSLQQFGGVSALCLHDFHFLVFWLEILCKAVHFVQSSTERLIWRDLPKANTGL